MEAKKRQPAVTWQSREVLSVIKGFTDVGVAEWRGADIIKATGFSTGTVYPLLTRWTKRGWLIRREDDERRKGQRYYEWAEGGERNAWLMLAGKEK